jgi:uncharacterized protein (TIGR02680 family)
MTTTFAARHSTRQDTEDVRFTLHRAGILNVWQYDEQEFAFSDGRLLLRGANGAGKSKTLEMLLPFVLDGDKARITASAKHHTSLLWLMTDGYEGQARTGYVWVEFARVVAGSVAEVYTCGVGIRASASARTATAWHFATTQRIGHDLFLEDAAGPLPRARLEEEIGDSGHVFEKAAAYKEHVGRTLFGLEAPQYDEVLRLLYWLRQPQVGEDIEPAKLAQQLSQALPALDEQAVRAAGDTFDELTAFGEQIQRRAAAAEALEQLADAYTAYARAAVAHRARTVAQALREERRLRSAVKATQSEATRIDTELGQAQSAREDAAAGIREADARLSALQASPEFRSQQRLSELIRQAERDEEIASGATSNRERREADAQRRSDTLATRRGQAETDLHQHAETLRGLDRRLRQAVPGSGAPVPALLEGLRLEDVEQREAVATALDHGRQGVQQARTATAARTAGIGLVLDAVGDVEAAVATQRTAEQAAEQAEARWERARDARLGAERIVEEHSEALAAGLREWAAEPNAPTVDLPDELTEESVKDLPRLAADAARPRLTALHADQAAALARRDAAAAEQERLTAERAEIEAQRDPAPPAPVLARSPRTDGLALWQVIDFADGLEAESRAGLEAALQAAGLLDAWVRPGGRLLDPDHQDVVLAGSSDAASHSLAGLLVPDLPPEADVTADDVQRILTSIGTGEPPDALAWIAADGRWRLGPAHGRATKAKAQYIGATARAQERARRLALIDEALAAQRVAWEQAQQAQQELGALIGALENWQARVPRGVELIQAWTRLEERLQEQDREEQANRCAQAAAHDARTRAATARATLERLAGEQELPTDRAGLIALEQELRSLDEALRDTLKRDEVVRDRLGRWLEAATDLADVQADLAQAQEAESAARYAAGQSQAAVDALRSSLGDSIQELQDRIAAVRAARASSERAEKESEKHVQALTRASGQAQAEASNAQDRLDEHLVTRAAAIDGLVAVTGVPGMVEACGMTQDDEVLIAGLAGLPPAEPAPRHIAGAADRLSELSRDDAGALDTRVWTAYNNATSGAAADHQPSVAKFGELLTVTGRDDASESPIVTLARRVRASVEGDRDLLTEREKQQFEQHILGELGDAIRQRRRDAEELVTAMNEQLGKVTTTQGIRVRLDWRLREDVPAEASAAVKLLAQPVGALIPEERASLRDALHRLIEASRAERPENTYGEHLAAALDYRTWSEFTIRYTRPEKSGQWERLHRRSPLSQGEQKVLCYLPLFAAAAAHFTALAGAAPHAPRLVLLDDAFPKIDVRTHPLLFGLLVQLDLDFVITSERLWGDHDTVPSLAIYEALRDPSERGIAQYHYEWDGRALHSLG